MAKNYSAKRNRSNVKDNSPTTDKDREYFQKKLGINKNFDVRYWKNVEDLKQKISSSLLGAKACSPDRCPVMKQRLERHRREHHSNNNSLGDTLSVTPIPKTGRDSRPSSTSNTTTQTSSFNDQSEGTENGPPHDTYVLLDPDLYKKDLENVVLQWIQNVPIYPYTTDNEVIDNAINSLIVNLYNLADNVKNIDYEENVKNEIDNFLYTPGMWYPDGNVNDEVMMKESLKNYLWNSITEINDKHFVNNKGDGNDMNVNTYNKDGGNQANYNYLNTNLNVGYSVDECKNAIENEIREWLKEIKETSKVNKTRLCTKETLDVFLTRLTRVFDQQNKPNYKTILKTEIVNIVNDLRIWPYNTKNSIMYRDKYAESLSSRLINIQTKCKSFNVNKTLNTTKVNNQLQNIENERIENNNLKHALREVVSDCLDNKDNDIVADAVEDTIDIIIEKLDNLKMKDDKLFKAEISNLLRKVCDISKDEASNIAQEIADIAHEVMSQDDTIVSAKDLKPRLSGVVSVYALANNSKTSTKPVTSTPKPKVVMTKKVPQNPEERSYMSKLINLIRAWMDTLPGQFQKPEDKNYKESIISELAGNILDETKLAQVVPHSNQDKRRFITYFVLLWLQKFKICTDLNASKEQGDVLVDKVLEIPVPVISRARQGSNQEMKNIKYTGNNADSFNNFGPNISDNLEDEISLWINEQPPDIYTSNDKSTRSKMVQELAGKVRTLLAKNSPHKEITQGVAQSLRKIVKPGQKSNVGQLSEKLKDRIVKSTQNQRLSADKSKVRQEYYDSIEEPQQNLPPPTNTIDSLVDETDKTLLEFIEKYIEHSCDMDDPLARGAFTNLLKTQIQKLSPPTRKEVYDNFMKSSQHDYFSTERLDKELLYIKIVADWLKTLPLDPKYGEDNKFRMELINNLAKDIFEIEDRRIKAPDEMDHDAYLESIILVHASQLPTDQKIISDLMIKGLIDTIIARRYRPCCQAPANETKKIYRKEEIGDFIEEYVQENSKVLADDVVKMEACSARLLKEVKQIVQETADPATLSKEKVYENLNQAPVPGEESVRRFNLALDYAKEITEWMKNLPLLPISNQPKARESIMKMISALADKMVERHCKKAANPGDTNADDALITFAKNWISELPLDPHKEIVYPVVLSQLMNRMKKVDMKLPVQQNLPEKIEQENHKNDNETKRNSIIKTKTSISNANKLAPGKTGEDILVDAIEQWCNSLPIKGKDDTETKAMKDNVAKNLYQKFGELNANPTNDDLLYQEMVADEIYTQLENVPQNPDLENNKEKLKATLLQEILEAKHIMKEASAGDNYKHKLEKTIESSVPYPVQNLSRDPAFEIYKNRLAEEFILENFDHGNDAVKMNYEKRIKKEIDKHFQSAQNRNAIPLSKDRIYNELYSSLFKVPIPNQNSIVEEVEEVKTKCEIDKWFQDLPLRPAEGVGELLEWDKILSTIAKRIHELEKSESEPDGKIHKEITKWLLQLPLLPGQQKNVDQLANNLQNLLKITTESRKFVPMPTDDTLIQSKTKRNSIEKVNKRRVIGEDLGSSKAGRRWVGSRRSSPQSSQPSCCQVPPQQQKSSAEIIQMMVKIWCQDLPIRGDTIQEQVDAINVIDNLMSKIMLKIRELNSSPAVLNDDILYNELFDDALEDLLSTLPPNRELQESKEGRKRILINGIQSVKPLIIEEKARQEYKNELNETVCKILGGPHDTTATMAALFDKIKEDIVENFVEYNYNKDDDEGKQAYKMLIHDAVLKYFSEIVEKWDNPSDILMKRNELLCELSKIPIPTEPALKQEIYEIRMKNEVRDFFDALSLPEENEEKMALRDQMKTNLAKMLNDIEKGGHNCSNDKKMNEEISRCLKKLNIQVKPEVIDAFVTKLKSDELEKKAPPPKNELVIPSPCHRTMPQCGQTSGILKMSTNILAPNSCQAVHAPALLCAGTAPQSSFRGFSGDVVLSSSACQFYGTAQQIPNTAAGSVHRSLSTSIRPQLQSIQVPANVMMTPPIPQPSSCQQSASCQQPVIKSTIPNVTRDPQVLPGQCLNTAQTSSASQSTGTSPITGLFERLSMAQAPKPDQRPDNTRAEDTRPKEMRDGPRLSSEDDDECICESERRPRCRNPPPCYYPRDYCNHCEDMMAPWWNTPHPEKKRHKISNNNKMKSEISRCLKMMNVKADPEVIETFLNKLKTNDRSDKQAPLQRNENVKATAVPSDIPSYDYSSGVLQASAIPMVPNQCQAVQATVTPCGLNPGPVWNPTLTTSPLSNFRGSNENYGDILSSPIGQHCGASEQTPGVPDILDGSDHRSIQGPNVFQGNSATHEAMPRVLPNCQLLSAMQTPTAGQSTAASSATGPYERHLMAQALESDRRSGDTRPRETRPQKEDRRSRYSSEDDVKDRYDGRRRPRNCRNQPPWYHPRDYCADCNNMMPPWWSMPYPGYF